LKISLITAVYNRHSTIQESIRSVQSQSYPDVEHVVVDGASSDGTVKVIKAASNEKTVVISERDDGIYDALNKGIAHASGNLIGLMHSDDFFAHNDVLQRVSEAFSDHSIDAVYGDLQYVAQDDTSRVIRHWNAGEFSPLKLSRGWMPPHPALFLRSNVFDKHGVYDTSYRIAADYDAILRWFGKGKIKAHYIPEVLVKMRVGGESNKSLRKILQKSREDYRALRSNDIGGVGALAWKNASKIRQFIVK